MPNKQQYQKINENHQSLIDIISNHGGVEMLHSDTHYLLFTYKKMEIELKITVDGLLRLTHVANYIKKNRVEIVHPNSFTMYYHGDIHESDAIFELINNFFKKGIMNETAIGYALLLITIVLLSLSLFIGATKDIDTTIQITEEIEQHHTYIQHSSGRPVIIHKEIKIECIEDEIEENICQ